MDTLQAFFKNVQSRNLPFVVYRKPGEKKIQAFRQKNSQLYPAQDYEEEGFVFAPFDTHKVAVLFPVLHSDRFQFQENGTHRGDASIEVVDSLEQKKQHLDLVQKGVDAIIAGAMEKVVLSRKQTLPLKNKNPYTTTQRLLAKYPNAFVYCWYHPAVGLWLGATPETLLTIKNRKLETMALAGTQVYEGSLDVAWGAKEKKEQELVTQAIVQNLEPLVGTGLAIEGPITSPAGTLLHLKTTITANLHTTETSLRSILEALHPTPAICGLPRDKAKAFINKHEGYDRSFYTGYLGELNIKKTVTRATQKSNVENTVYQAIKRSTSLFVNLRCMQWVDNEVCVYVGGGITRESAAEKEWEETVNKLSTMYTILDSD